VALSAALAQGSGTPAATAPAQGSAAAPVQAGVAAPLSVEVLADRTRVTVGDPIRLTYTMRHARGVEVVTFDADRSLAALTLLDQVEGEPHTLADGRVEETHTVTLAAYEPGTKEIAPVRIVYRPEGGAEGSVTTAPIKVEVASVLVAGQNDPADIKKQIALPEGIPWLWVGLGAALVAAAVAAGWWWRRRRRRPVAAAPVAPPAPARPAHEIAYAELERLLASGLLERGESKKFHIELAEIARRYIAARYGIETFERTTFEILEALHVARLSIDVRTMASELLGNCDLVKFAKYLPAQDETRRTVERAYRFVDETRATPAAAAAPPMARAAAAGEAS
jgi:oxygen tolerance protein BatD